VLKRFHQRIRGLSRIITPKGVRGTDFAAGQQELDWDFFGVFFGSPQVRLTLDLLPASDEE
jgi:hypothetical protein